MKTDSQSGLEPTLKPAARPASSQTTTLQRVLRIVVPVFAWIIGVYAFTQAIAWYAFDFTVWPGVWVRDIFLNLMFGSLLYAISRGFWPWAIAYSVLVGFLQFSNALKYAVLGSPIMPDDFLASVNMLMLFDDWRLGAMILALAAPVLLWAYAIAWRRPATWAVFGAILAGGSGFVEYAAPINRFMDAQFGDRVWDQPGNYRDRGLIQHVLHETSRNLARGRVTLSADAVSHASAQLFPGKTLVDATSRLDGRNVHLILLESFFDPMLLTAAGISEDPIDPRFRALWRDSGGSTALAPVYGGYTANSEFEVLCGFPVTHNAVFFEGWLRNHVPCLPEVFSRAGYRTVASHPNYAAFWNRVNAYDRIGFRDYWAMNDFELDDMNGPFLSDASLYRQVHDKQQVWRDAGQPVLNYVVTYFGHMDYPLNAARPNTISVADDPNMVEAYVNTLYYKSRELMDYYARIRAEDPDALIIIFGDHLPFLGPNYQGYVESGVLAKEKGQFTPEMFLSYAETPLIVVDGRKPPLPKMRLPMYRMPSLVAALMGDTQFDLLDAIEPPPGLILRPLPGITLVLDEANQAAPFTCADNSEAPACAGVLAWLGELNVLTQDIFAGQQLALGLPDGQSGSTVSAMTESSEDPPVTPTSLAQ